VKYEYGDGKKNRRTLSDPPEEVVPLPAQLTAEVSHCCGAVVAHLFTI